MENLTFDSGVKEYKVNGKAILRFNPTDNNIYARFVELYREIGELMKPYKEAIEKYPVGSNELDENGFEQAATLMEVSRETDLTIKKRLQYVFGEENDFDAMFDGINSIAITDSGNTVIENFLEAILPIVETNAEKRESVLQSKVDSAVGKAKMNRESRRAIANGKLGTT